MRPRIVRAPATDTCWPTIARTASSKPSAQPGTRRPGRRRTSSPNTGIGSQVGDHRRGIGVEVEQPPAARHGGVEVAGVVEPQAAAAPLGRLGRQLDDAAPPPGRSIERR